MPLSNISPSTAGVVGDIFSSAAQNPQIFSAMELVLILLSGLFSAFTTVFTFLIGIFAWGAQALQSKKEEMMSFSYIFKLAVIPFIYLIMGLVIFSFFSSLFSIFYDGNLFDKVKSFLEFTSLDFTQISATKRAVYEFVNSLIIFVRNWMVSTVAITYIFIPLFFLSQAVKILEIPKMFTSTTVNTSIFAVIAYAVVVGFIGILVSTLYDSIVSLMLFKNHPNIPGLGFVSSVSDLATSKLKEGIKIALDHM